MEETKRELLLEKRLNDLSNASLPKPKSEKVVAIRSATVEAPNLMLTPDQLDLRDLAYEARANTISTNAIVQRLDWKPSKIQSAVTKEMIADYQFEQAKRVQRGVYIPANLDIDLEPGVDPAIFSDANQELEGLFIRQKELIAENTAIDEALLEVPNIEKQIDDIQADFLQNYTRFLLTIDEINMARSMTGNMPSRRELDAIIPLLGREQRDMLVEYLADYDKFDIERETLKAKVLLTRTRYDDNAFTLARIDARIIQLGKDLQEVGAVKSTIDQRNAQRRQLYVDQIKLLNDGRMDVEMLPNETQEEYTARLEEVGATTPDPDSVQAAAKLFYTDVLREKLQEIVVNDAEISTFVKGLNGDDRYRLVKQFPQFKKQVQDQFGTSKITAENLSGLNVSLSESLNVIKDALISIAQNQEGTRQTVRVEAALEPVERELLGVSELKPTPEALRATVESDRKSNKITSGQATNLMAFIDNENTPLFRSTATTLQVKVDRYDWLRVQIKEMHTLSPAPYQAPRFQPTGSGIKRDHANVAQFGRVDIHPQRLHYDNVLKVTKNGRSITGMPNTRVSDAFASVVMSVLKQKTPTLKDFTKMSASEKQLYDTLVIASGLHKDVETVGSGVKEDLKKRLALIEGEVEAGNTNSLLIKEARHVLHKMAQMKMVSRPKAVAHLKQLQAFH
jgi:hypothetical protein